MPTIMNTQAKNGLNIKVYQKFVDESTTPLAEPRFLPTSEINLPCGVAVEVDQDFWDTWKSQNFDSPLLLNGVVTQVA